MGIDYLLNGIYSQKRSCLSRSPAEDRNPSPVPTPESLSTPEAGAAPTRQPDMAVQGSCRFPGWGQGTHKGDSPFPGSHSAPGPPAAGLGVS